MKAVVYYGPRDVRVDTVENPRIQAEHEILVKVRATSICGSDLHIYRGTLDGIMERAKSRLGHELSGEVVEVGKAVGNYKPGDRVTMAYSASCGECYLCRVGQTAHCTTTNKAVYGFGNAFGDLNGTQAEYMVIPYADAHAVRVDGALTDEQVLTLSCNLPSALIANRLADVHLGESVAVVGLGPTGIMSLELALHRGPGRVYAFDPVSHRTDYVKQRYGVEVVNPNDPGAIDLIRQETGGHGVDKVIEIVGTPESLQLSLDLVRPGGSIAAIGVFTSNSFNLNLADVFLRDLTVHMNGFANVQPYMWESHRLLVEGVIDPRPLFTHQFPLEQAGEAYRVFAEKSDGAMKVLIRP
ncbi:alcohol dehydrogenase [Effusibacillus lacus]|uniref:Alcohol dehydrogenase n=1 Tax=Effusibacillus lacus TaxID=1348429 RepID=A0A292YS84_9BACL|nr:alcohol dehydrogenase [Effusibacillus lacus]TCS76955.1 2-desacetyl-2-hydroxyethyl bacteriochlorophyllide A dehydrogenase [Effusibacillus lacus]GAX91284.1 alcohol dehydrogenase [Effusibacillus lacus]